MYTTDPKKDLITDTSYTEKNATLASSYFIQYVISSVRYEGDEEIVSRKQTGSEKITNSSASRRRATSATVSCR